MDVSCRYMRRCLLFAITPKASDRLTDYNWSLTETSDVRHGRAPWQVNAALPVCLITIDLSG